jgi:hypothetical protein
MHQVADELARLREMADGFRAQMIENGWSKEFSQEVSAHLLKEMILKSFDRGK